jgi:hypothetical protein
MYPVGLRPLRMRRSFHPRSQQAQRATLPRHSYSPRRPLAQPPLSTLDSLLPAPRPLPRQCAAPVLHVAPQRRLSVPPSQCLKPSRSPLQLRPPHHCTPPQTRPPIPPAHAPTSRQISTPSSRRWHLRTQAHTVRPARVLARRWNTHSQRPHGTCTSARHIARYLAFRKRLRCSPRRTLLARGVCQVLQGLVRGVGGRRRRKGCSVR